MGDYGHNGVHANKSVCHLDEVTNKNTGEHSDSMDSTCTERDQREHNDCRKVGFKTDSIKNYSDTDCESVDYTDTEDEKYSDESKSQCGVYNERVDDQEVNKISLCSKSIVCHEGNSYNEDIIMSESDRSQIKSDQYPSRTADDFNQSDGINETCHDRKRVTVSHGAIESTEAVSNGCDGSEIIKKESAILNDDDGVSYYDVTCKDDSYGAVSTEGAEDDDNDRTEGSDDYEGNTDVSEHIGDDENDRRKNDYLEHNSDHQSERLFVRTDIAKNGSFNGECHDGGYFTYSASSNELEEERTTDGAKSFYLSSRGENQETMEQICIQQHHLRNNAGENNKMSHVTRTVKRRNRKIKGIHDIERMVESIVTLSEVFGPRASDAKLVDDVYSMNENKVNSLVDMLDNMPVARRRPPKSELAMKVTTLDSYLPYVCDVCQKGFKKRFNFMRHRLSHARRASWTCPICNKSFGTISMFNRHKSKHLPKKSQKLRSIAKNCSMAFSQPMPSVPVFPTLTKMLESGPSVTHTPATETPADWTHKCTYCNKSFRYKVLLTFHMNAVHDTSLQQKINCEDCGMKYRHKVSISRHKKIQTKSDLSCQICGVLSTSICEHRQHLITHTNDPLNPFMCPICFQTFPRLICLKTHKYVHTENRPFECEICLKSFKTAHHLKSHSAFHRNPCVINVPALVKDASTGNMNTDVLPRFVCSLCNRMYFTRSGLRRHHKQTHDIMCTICRAQFLDADDLRRHIKTHVKKKREPTKHCDVCGKNFQGNNDLRKHLRIHSGEKPFACELCDKTFRQSVHLREHHRKHTGERPFLCQICEKTFQFSSSLRKHERTQHGLLLSHTPPKKVKTTPCSDLLHVKVPKEPGKTIVAGYTVTKVEESD